MSMHFCSLQEKTAFLAVCLFFTASFCFSQNGIPIDALQNDPYFRKGAVEEQQESEAANEAEEARKKQEAQQAAEQAEEAEALGKVAQPQKRTNKEDDLAEVIIPSEVVDSEPIIDARVDLSLGYMGFYTYPLQAGGISEYFDMDSFYNIDPYGAAFKIESMKLPSLFGVNGVGLGITWNPLERKAEHYTLYTNLVTAHLFFAHKIRFPGSRLLLELHAGGGGMFFLYPTFTYETGYEPKSFCWVYPDAMAGMSLQLYFTRHWGIDITVDAVFPFLTEAFFPVAQVSLSSGWHF